MSDTGDTDAAMPGVDIEALRDRWIGESFDLATFEVGQEKMLAWAEAVSEHDSRFTDPDHPDFQAHPTFTLHLGVEPHAAGGLSLARGWTGYRRGQGDRESLADPSW